MQSLQIVIYALFSVFIINNCASMPGNTIDEQIKAIETNLELTLVDLYAQNPETKKSVSDSVGYAVMKGTTRKYPFIGTASGYGVAVNNSTEEKSYFEIAKFDIGAGLGVRNLRCVIIFQDKKKFSAFTSGVWKLRVGMEAAAKNKDGGTASGAGNKNSPGNRGYSVHLITDSGTSATATLGVFQTKPIKPKN